MSSVVSGVLALMLASMASGALAGQQPGIPGHGADRTRAAVPSAARPGGAPLERAGLEAWLDGLIPFALAQGDIAGAVVVVVKDGAVLLQKGYGHADVARRIPMDPERTLVAVGSVSKLFTWTAVMQQVERGRLDLDRDVNAYLDFALPEAFGQPITLRHLMTHSAGFEERSFRSYPTPRKLAEHVRGTRVPARIYPPGQVAAYSNYGSMLGGYLVERVAGMPFVEYVDRHILAPLGMTRSTFERPLPARFRDAMARSYDAASEPPLPADRLDHEEPAGDPSGHLVTTAADISRFMLAHLGSGRLGDDSLFSAATARLMRTPTFEPVPGGHSIALGFFRLDRNGHQIIGHPGAIEGFHSDLELLPEQGVGWFIAINSDGARRGLLGAGPQLRQSFARMFMDRYFPAPPEAEEPTAATAQEHARLAAGEYWMSRRPAGDFMEALSLLARHQIGLEVTANPDGTIVTPGFLDFERGRPQTWREVGPFQWREVGGPGRLDMKVENGRVTAFIPRDLVSFVAQPVPPAKGTWNVEALVAAGVALVLTVLWWPVAAARNRWNRTGLVVSSGFGGPRDDRLLRTAAVAGLVYLGGWTALVSAGVDSRDGMDLWIRLVQLIGLAVVAGAVVALITTWRAWRKPRSLGIRLWHAITAVALLELVWFSVAFRLLSIELNY